MKTDDAARCVDNPQDALGYHVLTHAGALEELHPCCCTAAFDTTAVTVAICHYRTRSYACLNTLPKAEHIRSWKHQTQHLVWAKQGRSCRDTHNEARDQRGRVATKLRRR